MEIRVVRLFGESLRPIEGQVEVAASVVELVNLARGGLVVPQEEIGGVVQGSAENCGLGVVVRRGEVFEGNGQR